MLPVIFLVNLRTHGFVQVPQARGRQRCLINVLAMFIMTVLRCKAPPPNLNPPIFVFRPLGTKPPNLMTANISGYTVCRMSGPAFHPSPALPSPLLSLPFLSPHHTHTYRVRMVRLDQRAPQGEQENPDYP